MGITPEVVASARASGGKNPMADIDGVFERTWSPALMCSMTPALAMPVSHALVPSVSLHPIDRTRAPKICVRDCVQDRIHDALV